MFSYLSHFSCFGWCLVCCCYLTGTASAERAALSLVDFGDPAFVDQIEAQDVELRCVVDGESHVLEIATGTRASYPGITLRAPAGHWDLRGWRSVVAEVTNQGPRQAKVHLRVDNPGADGANHCVTRFVTLQPGETQTLQVPLDPPLPPQLRDQLFGMRGFPGGRREAGIDSSRITQLIFFVSHPEHTSTFRVTNVQAIESSEVEPWEGLSSEEFFPMIDPYGQFKHREWPGKVDGPDDLQVARTDEARRLATSSGPPNWNAYGGWLAGPQLKATGAFRVVQRNGNWWLVDPTGRLFWSHGVDCVTFHAATPISDREFYFEWLPAENDPLGVFYGRQSWAPHGYYRDHMPYRVFDFRAANLVRKYGEAWRDQATEVMHRRLRDWGLNTIGNWSDAAVYLRRQTPYVASLGTAGARRIEGSTGYWGKFPDPFDVSFRETLERGMNGLAKETANDPWCLGYFVDNELAWGDDVSLAEAALASPVDQPAKVAFVDSLRRREEDIAQLNARWHTSYASWEELATRCELPPREFCRPDLEAFYSEIAERYFQQCAEVIAAAAPDRLYLGCRFSSVNDRAVRAAAQYCDILTYNLYRDSIADFRLPEGVDVPVLVGEFHFGALDRGMFHTGLRPTANQQARAAAYRSYVEGALRNPVIVGTHWFQYGDQATTGRGDGENYQIGFVDICDTPYPETIEAVRRVGYQMYEWRLP